MNHSGSMDTRALVAGIGAYFFWGALPIYWHALSDISPLEILAHRIFWSLVFLTGVMAYRGDLSVFRRMLRVPKFLKIFLVSSVLLSCNWGLYIWAVQNGRVVECSFGYFISPLITFLLGVVVLRESIRPLQTISLLIAAVAVAQIGFTFSSFPWIAFALAGTFSIYTLLRRRIPAESLPALAIESLLMLPAAPVLLFAASRVSALAFPYRSLQSDLLILCSGVLTAFPLILFARAARELPFSTLGMIQYLSPSLQFLIGVAVFHEPLDSVRFRAFLLVWIAIAIFSGESWLRTRRSARAELNRG